MSEMSYVIRENTFFKTDIPAMTLIVYSCISVKHREYESGIDEYLGVRLSMEGGANYSPSCFKGECGQ